MAPPVTPSPHRFVIKKDNPASVPTASQFNITPRFNFTPTSKPTSFRETPKFVLNPLNFPTLTQNKTYKNEPPKFILNHLDSQVSIGKRPAQNDTIEVESDDTSDSGMSLNENPFIKIKFEDESKSEINEEPASKRRKNPLSLRSSENSAWLKDKENEQINDPDDRVLPSPKTPAITSHKSKKLDHIRAPHFLISSPDYMMSSRFMKESLIFAKPPVFRPLDSASELDPHLDPNPDQFSPHRRGEKYIAGGLAAELRNWLVNIKSSIPTSQTIGKDQWLAKILVEDLNGSSKVGMVLVRGRRLQNLGVERGDFVSEIKIILASEISGIGLQKSSEVEKGTIVGIREPIWEVTIENEKWTVCVDWKVI